VRAFCAQSIDFAVGFHEEYFSVFDPFDVGFCHAAIFKSAGRDGKLVLLSHSESFGGGISWRRELEDCR
jgi:hypothetical protein